MSVRALLIDDDKLFCQLLAEYLAPHGYDVTAVHNGLDGAVRVLASEYDLVLLDVMLPGIDGFEALSRIRASSRVPVAMLTARGSERERIHGLDLGADEYIPKTFSHRELLSRLNALMRRCQPAARADVLERFGISLDPARRIARTEAGRVDLTTVEFDVLFALMRADGRVLTREQLLREASQRADDVSGRSVDVHVSSIRRKLGSETLANCIETVRSLGYRFRDPVEDR